MKIERETDSYNDRRYGKPWIARVDFSANPQGEFTWGTWIGDPGDAGLLEIEAEIGDIVARGQKDFRKPKNSAPDWYQVIDTPENPQTERVGYLVSLGGRADALKAFRAEQKRREIVA